MKFRGILIMGAPGVGKGTQGRALGQLPGFFHCDCGNVFRTLNPKSELGKLFYEYSSRGELVPDELTVKLWFHRITQLQMADEWNPARDVLVLDGIPRNVQQAEFLDEHVDVLRVVELYCSDRAILQERLRMRALKENRPDDAHDHVIAHRLDLYEKNARALLAHYPAALRTRIDGLQHPLTVLSAIAASIPKE